MPTLQTFCLSRPIVINTIRVCILWAIFKGNKQSSSDLMINRASAKPRVELHSFAYRSMHIEPSVLNCELIDSSCPSFPQIVLIFYAIIRLTSGPQITTSSHRHSDAPVAVLPIVWLAFRAMITIALLQYTGPAFNDLDEWRGLEFGELFLLGREELPIFSKFP